MKYIHISRHFALSISRKIQRSKSASITFITIFSLIYFREEKTRLIIIPRCQYPLSTYKFLHLISLNQLCYCHKANKCEVIPHVVTIESSIALRSVAKQKILCSNCDNH